MRKNFLPNFNAVWAQTENDPQSVATFSLSTVNNINEGINEMVKVLQMCPCENTGQVAKNATKHILYLSGNFIDLGGVPVIARVRMRYSPQQGAGMELTVRSPQLALSETLSNIMFG